jgi:mannose-6-phosphate isomerase
MQIYEMKNHIKNYAWGSKTFLSELMGNDEQSPQPQAELWMGTHSQGISEIKYDNEWISLEKIISSFPNTVLGERIARQFDNKLPFLFKILAIDKPLSIQVHPDEHQAVIGFERENKLNISLSASNRNFKDKSHKPELVCALTSLWAMCGFRSYEAIQTNFNAIDENAELCQSSQALYGFLKKLMHLNKNQKSQLIASAVQYAQSRTEQTHWQWVARLAAHFPDDIGVLAPLYLNVICLNPGEALYLQPGVLHAYLDGNAVEVMCNSDNVIRGGLTVKHIDVEKLLDIVLPHSQVLNPIHPTMGQTNEWHYPIPINSFTLTRYDVQPDHIFNMTVNGPEILLCVKGNIQIHQGTNSLYLKPGMSAFVSYEAHSYILNGNGVIYKAGSSVDRDNTK